MRLLNLLAVSDSERICVKQRRRLAEFKSGSSDCGKGLDPKNHGTVQRSTPVFADRH